VKKLIILATTVVILASLAGCLIIMPGTVRGSGETQEKDFSLSGFTGIQVANSFEVLVERDDMFNVQVTADDNLWDSLDISVTGSTLHIGAKRGVNILNSTLSAVITLPSMAVLDLSGASSADVDGFSSDSNLNFMLSGASSVSIGNMKSGSTIFDLSGASSATGNVTMTGGKFMASGASKITLSGSGNDASIDASGNSKITLDQMKLQSVTVILSGSSEARVDAQKITSADLSGNSDLFYSGSPVIGNIQTSGDSKIQKE
jgi:hypothetical protein